MAINFVRQPSETPNVRNIDDIVPFRYAYGNQNGFVKDKGNELSYTINGSNFRINSGRVVLFGVESDIDANGVTITVDNVATTRYYSVYYKVNMATNTTSIESEYSTTDYPEIDPGDDLTANTSGTANLELYTFTALNGIISNVTKVVQRIVYTDEALDGYDSSKGTIEERLTNLGFKSDTTTQFSSSVQTYINTSQCYINFYRQGNYVLGKIKLSFKGQYELLNFFKLNNVKLCDIPVNFRPKTNTRPNFGIIAGESFSESVVSTSYYFSAQLGTFCGVNATDITLYGMNNSMDTPYITPVGTTTPQAVEFSFGYESDPIE